MFTFNKPDKQTWKYPAACGVGVGCAGAREHRRLPAHAATTAPNLFKQIIFSSYTNYWFYYLIYVRRGWR